MTNSTLKDYGATPPKTPKSEMFDKALSLISNGRSIIPVARDKKPLVDWKEFQGRRATKEEVEYWWAKFPEANIGLVTGKISNITVVDVEAGGDKSRFPETLTVRTGGGGWHLYYKYFPIQNKTRVFPLTDLRGDGGYVVAPPSIHASGKKYEMINKDHISDFPFQMFGEKKQTDFTEIVEGVPEGNRNDSASKMAGVLLRTFFKQPETAWRALQSWNKNNIPPLKDFELRNVFNSIKNRESKKEHKEGVQEEVMEVNFVSFTNVLKLGIQELESTREEDIISFGYDWLDEKLTGIFKGELIVIGGETGTGKTTFATNIIYKASEKYKCVVFALEDRLSDYGIRTLFFKINSLRKKDKREMYSWNNYRKNIIMDRDFPEYKNRAFEELKNENVLFVKAERQMNIETLERVVDEKVKEGCQLFLIDHLHYFDLLRGDTTKADYIEKVMVRMKQLQNRTGARIILIVHYKKLEGKKPYLDSFKDSISIVQNANYVINIWRERGKDNTDTKYQTEISIPKSRNPNGECHIKAEFDPETNDYKKQCEWASGSGVDINKEFENYGKHQMDF